MAVKRKSGGGGGGANWMDTYGDMVTLLLCFFVLLYSMSTISEEKFRALVQSFNPSALEQTTMTSGNEGPLADESEGVGSDFGLEQPENVAEINPEDIDAALQALMEALSQMAAESGQAENIEVTKGDGYIFVSFNSSVFFAGESAEIQREGQEILDVVAAAINTAAPYVDELRIMGHTARSDPENPNRIWRDRYLSSNRATEVTIYIQERTPDLNPARIVSVGYGEWRNIDTNWTAEGRGHNRRVEMIITGIDLYNVMGDSLQQYTVLRAGEADLTTEAPPELVEALSGEGGEWTEEAE